MTEPITKDDSAKMGITETDSRQIQGFLKNHTGGTAKGIVRGNKNGVGIEAWRLLNGQFNPRTLQSTMASQHKELHPKKAKKMAEMPARLLEWEEDLKRCEDEGRTPPTEEQKRLALLQMMPAKETWVCKRL